MKFTMVGFIGILSVVWSCSFGFSRDIGSAESEVSDQLGASLLYPASNVFTKRVLAAVVAEELPLLLVCNCGVNNFSSLFIG